MLGCQSTPLLLDRRVKEEGVNEGGRDEQEIEGIRLG